MWKSGRWLWWVVPFRVALDLCGEIRVGSWSLAQVGHAVLFGFLLVIAVRTPPPAAPLAAAYTVAVAIGALRAESWFDAARYGMHLLTPVVWLAALQRAPRTVPRAWWVAAAVPVALSLVALAAGQPAEHELHGYPRLHGGYANLHSHAEAMAVFAAAAWLGARGDRLRAALALGATVALAFTFVRTAWLWVALAGFIHLLVRGRWRVALLGAGLAIVLVLVVLPLRERLADLVSLVTWTPPAEGWSAFGSWRGRIWTESFAAWWNGPAEDVWLGRGLGGQYGLHRHLDVHSDWLSVLVQLGPAGACAWLLLQGALLVALARRGDALAAEAFALLAAALVLAAFSNDWLVRGTPLLWTYGWVGLALASPSAELAGDQRRERERHGDPDRPGSTGREV